MLIGVIGLKSPIRFIALAIRLCARKSALHYERKSISLVCFFFLLTCKVRCAINIYPHNGFTAHGSENGISQTHKPKAKNRNNRIWRNLSVFTLGSLSLSLCVRCSLLQLFYRFNCDAIDFYTDRKIKLKVNCTDTSMREQITWNEPQQSRCETVR